MPVNSGVERMHPNLTTDTSCPTAEVQTTESSLEEATDSLGQPTG